MRRPGALPSPLQQRAFDRAAAADAHVPLGRLRRRDLARPFHGVRVVDAPADAAGRCRAYVPRLRPGDVFSHVTAALLHGVPLPARLEARTAVDVAAVHPAGAPSTRGVIGHRLRSTPDTVLIDGLPVCGPAETWCQLAGLLELEDLVAAADSLLGDGRSPGLVTVADLATAVEAPGRYRTGILRKALALVRIGSRSRQESRLRVLLVLGGLPEPALNAPVRGRDGRLLGHGDLVWLRQRVVGEYEGDQHRTDDGQWAYDVRRYEEFQAEGWRVLRVTKAEMRQEARSGLVERFFRALGVAPVSVRAASAVPEQHEH